MEKKKIVFILPMLNGGGAERVAVNYMRQLDLIKYELYVIVFQESNEIVDLLPKCKLINLNTKSTKNSLFELIKAIKNKQECHIETLSYKKNNEPYWVNFNMLPVYNSDGELSHWVSIQRDVTEEKKQEVEKEQLIKELTQNNKDLQQFS